MNGSKPQGKQGVLFLSQEVDWRTHRGKILPDWPLFHSLFCNFRGQVLFYNIQGAWERDNSRSFSRRKRQGKDSQPGV